MAISTTQSSSSALKRPSPWAGLFDVVVIVLLGLLAGAAHYSWRDGRTILNADSVQYIDAARDLLDPDATADFALRKPGYPLILAGVARLTGNMSWAAIAANHLFLAFLPLAAYALGRVLFAASLGWAAALITIAALQTDTTGDRIMSEASYMLLMTFGVTALAAGLKRDRPGGMLTLSGVLLAASWLIRSVAIAPIGAGWLCLAWVHRRQPRRVVSGSLVLLFPLITAWAFECTLNHRAGNGFRSATGSFGMMLMMRTRHFQGLPLPDDELGHRVHALLPERSRDDAYRASELDTWVAHHHAVADQGLSDPAFDALMKEAGLAMARAHPWAFARASLDVMARHLLRQPSQPTIERVPRDVRQPCVDHPAAHDDPEYPGNWYAYWALPNREMALAIEEVELLREEAETKGPSTDIEFFRWLRYGSRLPIVSDVLGVLRGVTRIWPGLAILLAIWIGIDRRTCALLAIAYVLDAGIIAICCPSEVAAQRYQCIWLATDATLSAALIAAPIHLLRRNR